MKTFAVFMVVLTLIVAGTVGYALFNTSLVIEGKGRQIVSAEERQEEFSYLRSQAENGTLEGVIFNPQSFPDAADCQFEVYTLRLKNNCLVPAKMVEMQIAPVQGDLLAYDEKTQVVIGPGEKRDVWCVLLTQKGNPKVRELTVTYYLWGNSQTVKYTYESD